MLELTADQVVALDQIEAKGFVDRVRKDLTQQDPQLLRDISLAPRLWDAFQSASRWGIKDNHNLVTFLRLEAYQPHFYQQPATQAWLNRPGRSADERFVDFLLVTRWQLEHPNSLKNLIDGRNPAYAIGNGRRGTWSSIGARWRRYIGRWSGGGRDGQSTG